MLLELSLTHSPRPVPQMRWDELWWKCPLQEKASRVRIAAASVVCYQLLPKEAETRKATDTHNKSDVLTKDKKKKKE